MHVFTIQRGMTRPRLYGKLEGALGATDLTGASVRLQMWAWEDGSLKVDREASIDARLAGEVSFDWNPEDTDTPGRYYARWLRTAMGLEDEPYPSDSWIEVRVI